MIVGLGLRLGASRNDSNYTIPAPVAMQVQLRVAALSIRRSLLPALKRVACESLS